MVELGLDRLPGPDLESGRLVRERARRVLRPEGALDRLDQVAVWVAEWQRTDQPRIERPVAIVFLADHGVTEEGVSAYPASVTRAMLAAAGAGVATVSVMTAALGVELHTVDVGVGEPTGNLRFEPALDADRFASCVEVGRRVVRDIDADLLVLGEMGIGNTTAAAALSASLLGGPVSDWVGPGSGVAEEGMTRKRQVITDALARTGPVTPLEALRQLGGAELAALAGAGVEAHHRSIPVLLDGFVVTAALMPVELERPGALDHCWPGHLSPEPGHGRLLERLGRPPLLDLGMRLGEASGALAALPIVRLAVDSVTRVATFEEWGIS